MNKQTYKQTNKPNKQAEMSVLYFTCVWTVPRRCHVRPAL